jgi:hypothetical protein
MKAVDYSGRRTLFEPLEVFPTCGLRRGYLVLQLSRWVRYDAHHSLDQHELAPVHFVFLDVHEHLESGVNRRHHSLPISNALAQEKSCGN